MHAAADSASTGSVAVRILAAASAREVRFNAQPRIHVQLCGALDSIHIVDRRNLPTPVVVGTTYRNVYVAVEIFGRVHADCIARRIAGNDTSRTASLDCASLDLKTTAAPRSPNDTTRPPRR